MWTGKCANGTGFHYDSTFGHTKKAGLGPQTHYGVIQLSFPAIQVQSTTHQVPNAGNIYYWQINQWRSAAAALFRFQEMLTLEYLSAQQQPGNGSGAGTTGDAKSYQTLVISAVLPVCLQPNEALSS